MIVVQRVFMALLLGLLNLFRFAIMMAQTKRVLRYFTLFREED